MKVLLLRSHQGLRDETVLASQLSLEILGQLLGEISEVYSYITWVCLTLDRAGPNTSVPYDLPTDCTPLLKLILYCPFTPFFVLFGDLLSSRGSSSVQRSLAAMESMCNFLSRMVPHHPQAAKIHPIAVTFVNYAKSAISKSKDDTAQPNGLSSLMEHPPVTDKQNVDDPTIKQPELQNQQSVHLNQPARAPQTSTQPLADVFNDPSIQDLSMDPEFWLPSSRPFTGAEMPEQTMAGAMNDRTMDIDAYGFFADSNFDWLSWDPNPNLSFT